MKKNILHILPFKIKHDGEANVSKNFYVEELNSVYSSNFRGRKLVGKRLDLPDGFGFYIDSKKTEKVIQWGRDSEDKQGEADLKCFFSYLKFFDEWSF